MADVVQRSTEDWQRVLGEQCRELRIHAEPTQEELRSDASLSGDA